METSEDLVRARLGLVQALAREQAFVQAYAYAIVRDHHLAEDVYQEVAVVLAQDWDRVPVGLPHAWLKEVVRRKALEVSRRAHRHVLLTDDTLESLAGAFDHRAADDGRLRETLAECVRKLSPNVRAVLECRYRDDCSCEATAARLGRTVQSVYAVLKRARLSLSECIALADSELHRSLDHG